ncbi:MAG: TonB family protein [Desulfobacterales bacterium]|nr:TonB family protein [Desulfobacterales bacterium]
MVAHWKVFDQYSYTDRAWIGMAALSILCHILFFAGVVFLPQLRPSSPSHIPSAVEVDLVSLPKSELQAKSPLDQMPVSAKAGKAEPIERKTAKPQEKAADVLRTGAKEADAGAVSLAPKQLQVKQSLKKKTYNVSKVITRAIARIEKEAPKSRPSPVLQAIDKLKKSVEGDTGMAVRGGTAAKTGMTEKTLELLDIYNADIWYRIQKNWAFSEEMSRGRTDLEAIIIAKILKDGGIRDIWFEKRSGNNYFDDSVFKAMKKSDPLPPLPEGFLGPYYEVGFRFNLSELKRSY